MNGRDLINPGTGAGLIGYVIGYGVGFGSAVYLLHRHLRAKYDQQLSDEVEATRLFYKSLEKPLSVEDVDAELYSSIIADYAGENTSRLAVSETSIFPDQNVDEDEEDDEDNDGLIRTISYTNDFHKAGEEVGDFYVFTFYREDGIVCDEDGQIVMSPGNLFGDDTVVALDGIPQQHKEVYVYDERTNTIWNIELINGAYADLYIQHSSHARDRRPPKKFRLEEE